MRAVVLEKYGGPEVLTIRDLPDLDPGPGEVRVAVAATALNRADVLERLGKYPPPGPQPEREIPGLEFAGTVDRVGRGVTAWSAGARVCGLLALGGYAEQVVTHERMLLGLPGGMTFFEAAAIPEVFFTAWDALEDKAGFRTGEALLVHAAASGVGTAAVQLGRLLGARRVWGTTRTASKAPRVEALGADRVFVGADFEEAVLAEGGADVILDFVGGAVVEKNLKAAATGGRIVQISYLAGSDAQVSLGTLLFKRLRLVGTTLRGRPVEEKMVLTQRFAREVWPHFATGRLKPVIDSVLPFDRVAEAHRMMEEDRNFGKIVLQVR